MNLLDVMRDPHLFGRHFQGDSWRPWLAFAATLEGRVAELPEDLRSLAASCTGRKDLETVARFDEAWVPTGRRAGKTRIAAALAAHVACFRDWRAVLAAGEVATIAVVAADRSQARIAFRYIKALITETPLLAQMIASEAAERLELSNGAAIEVFSCSSVRIRGYSIASAILDEIAYWPTDGAADPDTEILAALRPAMATLPGARLIAISSPYARRGALWQAYSRNHGRPGASKLIWVAPSRTMNATIPAETVAEALAEDPERGGAEWLANFRTDCERLFTREVVEGAVVPGRHELPPVRAIQVFRFHAIRAADRQMR